MAEAETKERVEWELPAGLLENLRNYCRTYEVSEEDAVRKAVERLLAERLLEEGE